MEIVSNDEQITLPHGVLTRRAMAAALVVATVAALAIASLVQSHVRATAQSGAIRQAPSAATVPLYMSLDSGEVGRFAFGHIEFDWDPAGGVPGFGSWPLGTPRP